MELLSFKDLFVFSRLLTQANQHNIYLQVTGILDFFFFLKQVLMYLMYGADDLELLLPPPLTGRDYRHVTPHLVYVVLGMKPRASCMLCNHSGN